MRYLIALAAAIMLSACGMFGSDKPEKAKAPLDDKTFVAQLVQDGKSQPTQLVFENGTFRSTSADEYGFPQTSYTAVQQGEFMKFEAVTKNPEFGTMTWRGRVRGETIEGTAVWDQAWYKPDREYQFKGQLKD